ncbi:hypothetical protein GOP47_0001078 [Adiantum capillus-veneris]|uniref:Pentatricopeptide repeat-containing protein n=1 Tax=Adiantum capillus-veneris TaxID=13818 RepID=A0A9D4ZR51_ADICA|nr:hypothetical protein GOP47_0001074 [Adiantum capillus-veneris]KAI5084909.1 hypothetical protein GOP47_0001078 [Adiantum capillus-veneris]
MQSGPSSQAQIKMERDKGGSQACFNQPDPQLAKLVANVRSSPVAALLFARRSYTCIAQHQDNSARSTDEGAARLSKKLPSVDNYISVLNSCREANHLARAKRVHVHMCENGLQEHPELGNRLVIALLKCGCRSQALNVFDRLHVRNEFSWTALIKDFVDSLEFENALHGYKQMIGDSVSHSQYTLVAALQACSGQKYLNKGQELHAQATKFGFSTTDVYLRSSLVDLYSKCGSMVDAQGLIDKQPERDVVSNTALMAGYVKQGAGDEALKCYDQMHSDGMSPGAGTFVCSLKAIILLGAVEKGLQVHSDIIHDGWETNIFIGSSLVDLYAKCGLLPEAQAVFDELPDHDVVSWTALISGYVEHGFGEQALRCLEKMDSDGVPQNVVTLMYGLKACSIIGATGRIQEMHSNITNTGYDCDLLVSNTLVDTYAKWGLLAEAWSVFNKLSVKDVTTWNSLISGYSQQGLDEEALRSFYLLRSQDMFPDVVTYVICLGACGRIPSIDNGRELHLEIVKQGNEAVLCTGSAVLDMYMKCQYTEDAHEVFNVLPARDTVSWTALVEGYAEAELYEEALNCLDQMQQERVPFHSHTYASALKACKGMGLVVDGQELHVGLVKMGFEKDIVVCNSLVDLYASSGLFLDAEAVFDKLPMPNEISWIVLMGGYGECGVNDYVLDCFELMQQEGCTLDAAACIMVLKSCGNLGIVDKGREIHTVIIREELEMNPFVSSSLVDMYSKCGFLGEALEVFGDLPVQDVVTWTALISGLVEGGFGLKALTYLEQMQLVGVFPNPSTFVCGLKACGSMKALDRGRKLHTSIVTEEFEGNIFVGSSLIDLYAKCGLMGHAQEIFDELPVKDVVAWTALIAGFNKNGLAREALTCFQQMKSADVLPNAVTFVCTLKACGSLEVTGQGQGIHSEVLAKGLETNQPIIASLVDMYARCGSMQEAEKVFDELEIRELMWWTALMAGYAKQSQTKQALSVLERMQLCGFSIGSDCWVEILTACEAHTTTELCLGLHNVIVEQGYDMNVSVHIILESMYANCGLLIGASHKLVSLAPRPVSLEAAMLAV